MTEKFQNKYRIPSARAKWWNYGNNAAYFVTICTKDRKNYFGEIVETPCMASDITHDHHFVETPCMASLHATEIGKIVELEWLKTPSIRPDMNLDMDAYVVMPNHFHGIIWIGDNEYNHIADPEPPKNIFGPQRKNLGSILRGFKSAVTTFAVKNGFTFGWQERFYDTIIREEDSYQRIRNYIINNRQNWERDKFFH